MYVLYSTIIFFIYQFTVGFLLGTVRPWDFSENGESHGKTVILGRSVEFGNDLK